MAHATWAHDARQPCFAAEVPAAARGGLSEGARGVDELARETTFRDFVCLYVAEGSKRNRNIVAICTPIRRSCAVAARWFRCLSNKTAEFWIQHHADQHVDGLRQFWGEMLHVDPETIHLQRKSNGNQLTGRLWRSRYGVLTMRVNDTLLLARMQAWMDLIRAEWQ